MPARGSSSAATFRPTSSRQWIQGTGPATRPGLPLEKSIRNVAYALLSGADGWMFDGEDALGQLSTMSLDNQRNLKAALDRDPVFLGVAERVAGRDERLGAGVFRSPHHRELAHATRAHHPHLPGAWAAPRRPACSPCRHHGALGLHGRHRAVRGEQPSAAETVRPHGRPVSAENPDGRRSGVLEPPAHDARAAPGAAGRRDQGLRSRRADRSGVPVDGDSRRTRRAFRRLQHGPLGLHQQRRRCDGVGSAVHQPEHRRHRHDVTGTCGTTRTACGAR